MSAPVLQASRVAQRLDGAQITLVDARKEHLYQCLVIFKSSFGSVQMAHGFINIMLPIREPDVVRN